MIDHPFISLKDLSEDELLNRTMLIQGKLSKAYMWGSSQEILDQLRAMLEMIEEEKMERLNSQSRDTFNAMFPPVIESDPEFQHERPGQEKKAREQVKPQGAKGQIKRDFGAPSFHKEVLAPKKPGGKK